MIRSAIALALILACSGCAGIDPNGYYEGRGGYNAQHVAKGAVLCHFPPKDRWHEFYATTNTVAACREVGGIPLK